MEKFTRKTIPLKQLEVNTGQIEGLPTNPRFIKDDKFKKLKNSIATYPEMLKWRELIVYPHGDKYIILAGNMRYRAMRDLGHDSAPCVILSAGTDVERLKAYTILDNNGKRW